MSVVDSDVVNALFSAYVSLSEPSFFFVEKRYKAQPYGELLEKLAEDYAVTETTDLNDDVAVTVALSGPLGNLGVRLSLVGPYAAISDPKGRIVDDGELATMTSASPLARRLDEGGVTVLGRAKLKEAIPFGGEQQAVPLYRLLFSTDEAVFV